jgi:hypothetical protein
VETQTQQANFSHSARVVVSDPRELWYESGPDPREDRPAFVRAASGLAVVPGEKIVVCQDDTDFLAVLDAGGHVEPLPLPSTDGVRTYSEARGNKTDKADLESCLYLPQQDLLLAFGSGSTGRRYRIAAIRGWRDGALYSWWIDATPLYKELAAHPSFAGSELNIEGVTVLDGRARFFQRGNGAPKDGLLPVNATADIPLNDLLRFLEHPAQPPPIENIVRYQLSAIGNVAFTFTDAYSVGSDTFFLAAAEDSPDTFRDGPVCASALGRIGHDGSALLANMFLDSGKHFIEKAEGLLFDPGSDSTGYIAIDRDNPELPATLWRFRIEGSFVS